MRRLLGAATVLAGFACVLLITTGSSAQATAAAHPLSRCFGHNGVEFGSFDDYACIGGNGLYFWVTLDSGASEAFPGSQAFWYKQHPDPGNFWVFETFTPNGVPRSSGRTVIIDLAPFGTCQVQFPSWSVTPTDCQDLTQGGQPGEVHQMTPEEQASVEDFMGNMRAAIPLEYR